MRRSAAGIPPVCILVSGGLDSAVLVGQALRRGERVRPVYVRAGLRWEAAELAALRRFLRRVASPKLEPLELLSFDARTIYGGHWSAGHGRVPNARSRDEAVELPGRNLLLIPQVACYAALRGMQVVRVGHLAANPFRDATPSFLKRLASLAAEAFGRPVRVEAPFRSLRKEAVIRLGRGLPLELTFSCIDPKRSRHCGACNKCVERKKAFSRAGIRDKTPYQKSTLGNKTIQN